VASIEVKKSANAGSATTSATTRKARVATTLPTQIAPVRRREHEPVEHSLLALGDEGATKPEQRSEQDRNPEQPKRRAGRGILRKREMEDDQHRDDEQQHRRQRVARPQLEQQVLAGECARV